MRFLREIGQFSLTCFDCIWEDIHRNNEITELRIHGIMNYIDMYVEL